MIEYASWEEKTDLEIRYYPDTDSIGLLDSEFNPFILIPRNMVIQMFRQLPAEPPGGE